MDKIVEYNKLIVTSEIERIKHLRESKLKLLQILSTIAFVTASGSLSLLLTKVGYEATSIIGIIFSAILGSYCMELYADIESLESEYINLRKELLRLIKEEINNE